MCVLFRSILILLHLSLCFASDRCSQVCTGFFANPMGCPHSGWTLFARQCGVGRISLLQIADPSSWFLTTDDSGIPPEICTLPFWHGNIQWQNFAFTRNFRPSKNTKKNDPLGWGRRFFKKKCVFEKIGARRGSFKAKPPKAEKKRRCFLSCFFFVIWVGVGPWGLVV